MNRPDSLEPHKPVSEMTMEEKRQYALALRRQIRSELREIQRPEREKLLRQGRAKPRNRRGMGDLRRRPAQGQAGRRQLAISRQSSHRSDSL
ncbi:MAG: hypothetical protein ACRDOH_10400 [Streptosporangiaceae bacterium]